MLKKRISAGLLLCAALLLCYGARAQAAPHPITIDGQFPDWESVAIAYEDSAGDSAGSGIDFRALRIADDTRFLYLQIDLGNEILLNSGNQFALYLDTDSDDQTGLNINGIGAELEWRPGDRSGIFYYDIHSPVINQGDIRFRAGPTVTSSIFELAFSRNARPDGDHQLFNGIEVRIFLRDTSTGGDELPEAGEILSYTLDAGQTPADEFLTLNRGDTHDIRIATYNVLFDSPWSGGNGPRFGRQLAAVNPDIISFQEIYDHTSEEVADFVGGWVEPEPGESWYYAGNRDCHTISRYPVLGSWSIGGNLAVLLDASPVLGLPILVINCHLYCCDDDEGRQGEVDQILSFIREAKGPGGELTLERDTPIAIMGDMNFVGLAQQVRSLLTGDIIDESTYGPDFHPDWDWTPLKNVYWRQTERRMGYTWRDDGGPGSYWPGHLDYVVYTDNAMEMNNHFALYTPAMAPGNLAAYGLQSGDSEASDHILCCADFHHPDSGGVVVPGPALSGLDLQIRPNPSAREAGLALHLPHAGSFKIEILDVMGRRISRPLGPEWTSAAAGTSLLPWKPVTLEGDPLRPGTYFVRIRSRYAWGGDITTKKWTYLR